MTSSVYKILKVYPICHQFYSRGECGCNYPRKNTFVDFLFPQRVWKRKEGMKVFQFQLSKKMSLGAIKDQKVTLFSY